MTELKSLVGDGLFEIVPMKAAHPFDSDADGVCFTLNDVTYLAFEDPSDGYRSSLGQLLACQGPAYSIGGDANITYIREEVICAHVETSEGHDGDDILEVRSKETGGIIFRVGTANMDDYYPWFVNEWWPQNLSANSKMRASD
jgi:hypothetical protein